MIGSKIKGLIIGMNKGALIIPRCIYSRAQIFGGTEITIWLKPADIDINSPVASRAATGKIKILAIGR